MGRSEPTTAPPASLAAYAIATFVTVFTILSQYFVPQLFPVARPVYEGIVPTFLLVYGVPIATFVALVGGGPLRGWAAQMRTATVEGLSWYGTLTLLALFLGVVYLGILIRIDPSALNSLNTPTPIVRVAAQDPWLWVGLSFAVGVVEELIFRGWIFGYWLQRSPQSWKLHAAWTSVLFAGVHVYYALTYGPVFIVPAVLLVLDGAAFAITMRNSAGNLVLVSLLHGWNDATVFMALAIPTLGLALHYAVVLVGAVLAAVLYVRNRPAVPPGVAPLSPRSGGGTGS
ncbi:MAG TPA: CPBP family intramembrane glutamic endopeptidase [Thermoplasmata archaeon]|nr:CPBP family intramembrane glutamic endopeptidase [Thermoplasmata archaeon]